MGISGFFPGYIGMNVLGYINQFSPNVNLAGINYMNFPREVLSGGLTSSNPLQINIAPFGAGAASTMSSGLGLNLSQIPSAMPILDPFVVAGGPYSGNGLYSSYLPSGTVTPRISQPLLPDSFMSQMTSRFTAAATPAKTDATPTSLLGSLLAGFKTEPKTATPAATPKDTKTENREELRSAITASQTKLQAQLNPTLAKAEKNDGKARDKAVSEVRDTISKDLKKQGFDVKSVGTDSLKVNGKAFDLVSFSGGKASLQADG